MHNEIDWGNIIAGFGGVFVLGVIGIVVHWYLGRREERERQGRRKP
jgi:hypothetical protein